MHTSIIGCGRWASFLAWYSARQGHQVVVYGRPGSPSLRQLLETRRKECVSLPTTVELTCDLGRVLNHASCVLVAVGAQQLRGFARELAGRDLSGKTFVLCMKGLEADTGKRLSEVLGEELGPSAQAVATWLGPGHVQDLAAGVPSCMVATSRSVNEARDVIACFSSELIEAFVQGERFAALAEGVATFDALLVLSAKHGVEMPICEALRAILHRGQDPRSVLRELLIRPIKNEFVTGRM